MAAGQHRDQSENNGMTSKLLRRIHMYLALFLTPWVLMYGLSTMAMNHHQSLRALYGGAPAFSMERELTYERSFDEDAAAGKSPERSSSTSIAASVSGATSAAD